ncbi:MAG: glutamyl-tRNA reductase, partial [Gemmatimonadetes bacterium]|nr:glutamyl-tRNA reductase [Gemmatimonadota bacterium]
MRLLVLGLNHRTAPVELRERVAFLGDEARDVLTTLRAHEAFQETALLSTCNRTELYVATPSPDDVVAQWRELVRARRQVDLHDDVLYRHESRNCVQHLMRVASGIDSMVLGETGILGQVRDAHTLATQDDTLGPLLGRLLPTALHAGKRARTETTIGEGAVSLAKAGVTLARKVFGDLSKRRVLVVGSGETGAQTAAHLAEEGGARITFANRTLERAEKLAKLHGGTAIGLDGVLGLLGEV